MSMFDNYTEDTQKSYNLTSCYCENLEKIEMNSVLYARDSADNLVGIIWHENDKFILKDTVNLNIKVRSSSIIYELPAEGPTIATEGVLGQRAYNILDWKCWVCKGRQDGDYLWKETAIYQDLSGKKIVTLLYSDSNSHITANIQNFRHENIYSFNFENTTDYSILIDKEQLPLLVQGQYFIEVLLSYDKENIQTVKTIPITIH